MHSMAAASWPAGKLYLALAVGAVAWSFPVGAYAQAPSPEAQTATNPINQAAESSGAQPSTLTGDWGGLRTLLSAEGIDIRSGFRDEAVTNVLGEQQRSAAQATAQPLPTSETRNSGSTLASVKNTWLNE